MAETNVRVENLVAGDTWKFNRTHTSLPTGVTIQKVYFTVKDNPEQDDADAVIQVFITDTLSVNGQITDNTTTSDGVIEFNVIVPSSLTNISTLKSFFYDFEGIATDDSVYTFETGLIRPLQGYTDAST